MRSTTLWYTISEGSVILKVDEETLRRLYRNNGIPDARKIGRQIRIPASFVEGITATPPKNKFPMRQGKQSSLDENEGGDKWQR